MQHAVRSLVISASWKLRSLCRAQRFYSTADLVRIFKAHVLSFIEYRTPAIIHCATTILDPLDHILDRFLNDIGISRIDVLIHFNLAPL